SSRLSRIVKKLSLIAVLLVVACSPSEAPAPQQQAVSQAPLPPNLLELTRGAAGAARQFEKIRRKRRRRRLAHRRSDAQHLRRARDRRRSWNSVGESAGE